MLSIERKKHFWKFNLVHTAKCCELTHLLPKYTYLHRDIYLLTILYITLATAMYKRNHFLIEMIKNTE